ncbi:MAG: hypothetical protein DWQ34_02615 [Planctomycetota bacterium]|nr:MAG: hypothetical protein DWQ34_02615 [Planctomycetota bacterium]
MPNHHRVWRWRDEFPQLFAAAWYTKRSALRSARWARDSLIMPSAWTTAVLAGALALLLTVLLLIADPPPEAAVPPTTADDDSLPPVLLVEQPAADDVTPPPALDLSVDRLGFDFEWDQQQALLWTSVPVGEPALPPAFRPPDDWRPATPRSTVADSNTAIDFEPYYLRATLSESDENPFLPASDGPMSPFGPAPARNLQIEVSALPGRPGDSNQVVVQSVLVRNPGNEPIEQVFVRQKLPAVELVIDVDPPAAITPDGDLIWELMDMAPGEERPLLVTMHLPAGEEAETVTQVDVQSQIGVTTTVSEPLSPEPINTDLDLPLIAQPERSPRPQVFDPEPEITLPDRVLPESFPGSPVSATQSRDDAVVPAALPEELPMLVMPEDRPDQPALPRPLPLDPVRPPTPLLSITANSPESAKPGDVVATVFEVVNTGDAPAYDLVLTVHVAPQLQHKHGEIVEHHIDRIAPGEQHTARLLTRAKSSGTARVKAVLMHSGDGSKQHWAVVRVTEGNETTTGR